MNLRVVHYSDGVSWRLRSAQRLSWLISALSGTLEIEAAHRQRMKEDEQEIARLDAMILQTRNETKQIEKETERLAVLESKIEALFCKQGIKLPQTQTQRKP